MILRIQEGDPAWKRGERAYLANVVHCKICKRPTNVIWQIRNTDRTIVACGKECADKAP